MNSILDFADRIITRGEGETFIKLLEKVLAYPQEFDAEDLSRRIVDEVFINPMQRTIHTSARRMFIEGLNTYLSLKYANGRPITIPDPPKDRRRGEPVTMTDGLTPKLNYTLATMSLDEFRKADETFITPTTDSINDNSKNIRRISAINDLNKRRSSDDRRQMRHYEMKPRNPVKITMNTKQPMLDRPQPIYNEYMRNEKNRQFLRRLKEASFKKNIATKKKDINKENINKYNHKGKASDILKLKRRQFNPTDSDRVKMDMDLLNNFKMPSSTVPQTFLEIVMNDETTRNGQFRAFDMPPPPPVNEMNNGQDIPNFLKPIGKQRSPPGFPPDMFQPPSKQEEKNNYKPNNFNILELNPNNFTPLNSNTDNLDPFNFNPNNFNPLNINPNSFNPDNFNTDNLNPEKPPDLTGNIRNLPVIESLDQPEKTTTETILTIPSRNIEVNMMTIDARPRNHENMRSIERKGTFVILLITKMSRKLFI